MPKKRYSTNEKTVVFQVVHFLRFVPFSSFFQEFGIRAMFDIFWNWQSFQADVPWLKILRFVDGCVCGFRGNSQICAGNSGNSASNVQNDSARTCSCVLVLLFILKAKTRLLLGLFMFRCFTLTACSALIELQDVTKTATNLWSFFQEMFPFNPFFIMVVTFFAGKNVVPFILRHRGSRCVYI